MLRLGLLLTAILGLSHTGRASDARFWLSTSSSGISGPEAPAFGMTVGETTTLYLWGRPTTDRQFDSLSVDVVASASGIDFVDGTYVFHNEIDGSTDRFEETYDSSTSTGALMSEFPPEDIVDFGDIDELRGLRGFTLNDTPSLRGPGPDCAAGETSCETAGDGHPAWLLAEFDISAVSTGSIDLNLEVGDRGVVERTLAPGDYDLDGEVANDDYTAWAAAYGDADSLTDGSDNNVVDAADYTIWRDHFGETATVLTVGDTTVDFGTDGMGGGVYDVRITVTTPAVSVPEPSAAAIFTFSALLLISNSRRRPTAILSFSQKT